MASSFAFGDFELDVGAFTLRRSNAPVHLERLPMECLIMLVRRAGSLVGREEIRQALWGSAVFVDHHAAINTAVRKIRQALDDAAGIPRFVDTVIGKGYRFIAPVEHVQLGNAGADPLAIGRYRLVRGRRQIELAPGRTRIGRDPKAAVHVDHPAVSRSHASISLDHGRALVEDLRSRNGTFVNGRRINGPTEVSSGTVLGVGPIAFRFLVDTAPRSTQPVASTSRRSRRRDT